jgi:ADP-ribose pyrophosphatase
MRFTNLLRSEEGWETRSTSIEFQGDHLSVVNAMVKTPSQDELKPWTIVHRKAAIVVAAQTVDGKFLLVRQERVPIHASIWETPAGQIDSESPDDSEIEHAALRELHEETGFELAPGGEMISLGHYFTSPGFTDEHCYFFLARPVQRAPVHVREPGESIVDCRAFTAAELSEMVARNEVRDANTLSICARMASRALFHF